jgi:hypothetical protein
MILSNEFVPSFSSDHSLTSQRLLGLSWTYYLPRSTSPPSVLFEQPLCAEIMGAGFQKLPFSQYYELRWPRLQKIFPPDARIWTEGTPLPYHELINSINRTRINSHSPSFFRVQNPNHPIIARGRFNQSSMEIGFSGVPRYSRSWEYGQSITSDEEEENAICT